MAEDRSNSPQSNSVDDTDSSSMAETAIASMDSTKTSFHIKASFDIPPIIHTVQNVKPKYNPLGILDPFKKKLTTVESQRILAVMDETLKKTELLSLTPFMSEQVERFSVLFGSDLVDALEQHFELVREFMNHVEVEESVSVDQSGDKSLASASPTNSVRRENIDPSTVPDVKRDEEEAGQTAGPANENEAVSIRVEEGDPVRQTESDMQDDNLDVLSVLPLATETLCAESCSRFAQIREYDALPDTDLEMKRRALSVLSSRLSHSSKNILRLFSNNPSAMKQIREEHHQRSVNFKCFLIYLMKLREALLERLLTTPFEIKNRNKHLEEVKERLRRNALIIKKLESDWQVVEDGRESEVSKRNEVIRKLKTDLFHIEKFSEESISRVRNDAEKQEVADVKNAASKTEKLTSELSIVRQHMANLIGENRDNEQKLRKTKYKLETDVESVISRFDNEMGERQDEYEDIDKEYTQEKQQLSELTERFETLEVEYAKIIKQREETEQRRLDAERRLRIMIRACTVVQAFWRSYKVRRGLKKGKKGKKGKKSGKGKKK